MTQPADHSREKRVDLILQQLEELPTLPAIAVKVLEVTANDESSAAEVVKLIETDVSLSARILQLVHRADMGVRGEVTTVERAVSLLGFEAAPWNARDSIRNSTGNADAVAACNRAAILRACIGSTRVSLSAVASNTAGYAVPSCTWWYGEYARNQR